MSKHREQSRVGLDENDLDRPRIGRSDLLHHPGRAAEQSRPRPTCGLDVGAKLPLEAGGDLQRGERASVMELDALSQREGPDEPFA